ncbi:MAG: AgmX/PglI C-terminal domain-containing protein, partial [Myxococcota bacterium]|nr:AgmX/PglI C-terminal domain-containing protein [Myxococcota bacterium]
REARVAREREARAAREREARAAREREVRAARGREATRESSRSSRSTSGGGDTKQIDLLRELRGSTQNMLEEDDSGEVRMERGGNTRKRRGRRNRRKQRNANREAVPRASSSRGSAANMERVRARRRQRVLQQEQSRSESGGLSIAQVERVISQNMGSLQYCYRQAAKRDSELGMVKTTLKIRVSTTGRPDSIRFTGAARRGPLNRCFTRAVKRWYFPKAERKTAYDRILIFQQGF